jgi:L-fucose mutarotase/ribose pyranase (RbsD/FucU family)
MRLSLLAGILCSVALTKTAIGGDMSDWKQQVAERIPLYGHRNWIVVADSAYPAQARAGIETIVADADQIEVLKVVLQKLSLSKHVRPIIHMDRELEFVPESEAPGVDAYRRQVLTLLPKDKITTSLHENIIGELDKAGETFRVLIIKTNMTVPYTSVFLQLDCAYWSPDDERKLRAEMGKNPGK